MSTFARGLPLLGLTVALAVSLSGCARPAVRGAGGETGAAGDPLRGTAPVEERARTASFALG